MRTHNRIVRTLVVIAFLYSFFVAFTVSAGQQVITVCDPYCRQIVVITMDNNPMGETGVEDLN